LHDWNAERTREGGIPSKDSLALTLKINQNLRQNQKMEIILEFIVVTAGTSAVAALMLISLFASSSKKLNPDKPSWGSE
jgi:aspartate/methionine/tyrosine aminotransferase